MIDVQAIADVRKDQNEAVLANERRLALQGKVLPNEIDYAIGMVQSAAESAARLLAPQLKEARQFQALGLIDSSSYTILSGQIELKNSGLASGVDAGGSIGRMVVANELGSTPVEVQLVIGADGLKTVLKALPDGEPQEEAGFSIHAGVLAAGFPNARAAMKEIETATIRAAQDLQQQLREVKTHIEQQNAQLEKRIGALTASGGSKAQGAAAGGAGRRRAGKTATTSRSAAQSDARVEEAPATAGEAESEGEKTA